MLPASPGPPPIALTSLSIRDFRGIDRLDLNFRGPDGLPNQLVVLAGPNGCGKTAVLEAALLACGGQPLLTGPRGRSAIRRGATDYSIRAEFLAGGHALVREVSARREPTSSDVAVPLWYFSSWRAPKLVGPVDVTVGRGGKKPARTDANRLKNVKQLLVNAAVADRFRDQSLFADRYKRWVGAISEAWRNFYPDSGQAFRVDFVPPDYEGEGTFDVFLSDPRHATAIEVDRFSAGQLEVFLFLAALVLNDNREGIVFIDEPELHLDPQWHAPIVRALMRLQPNAQFFIATHSPEIYDAAMSYERHFLVPDDDPGRSHGRASEPGRRRDPRCRATSTAMPFITAGLISGSRTT